MSRLSIINVLIGWVGLVIASFAGVFNANDISTDYVNHQKILSTWYSVIMQSSHGHVNMFAMLHILFGLTIGYSALSNKVKLFQTIGLVFGLIGMGPLMYLRASIEPSPELGIIEIAIGVSLSIALASMCLQVYGIVLKLMKRPYAN